METIALTPHPSFEPTRRALPDLEERVAVLVERERTLRSLLLDARDALQRSRLGADGPELRQPASSSGGAAGRSPEPPGYDALRGRLRAELSSLLPTGARALVVSRGDRRLLDLEGAAAVHFPDDGKGEYAGHHPADDREAIAALERARRAGGEFLVFPETSRWWLTHYRELAAHLERRHRKLAELPGTGVVFDLRPPAGVVLAEPDELASPRPHGSHRRPLAAVSIISRNYLAQARVLARSFLEHEPDSRFYLLVVDRLPDGVEVGLDVVTVDPLELGIPTFYEMCFKYGIVEFATAVKPFLLSLLMREYGEEEVVYFDPDILVVRPLEELRAALGEGDIVLTPHITHPLPLDGKRPSEQDIMISGAYNLGFIALRRSPQSERFLAWWQERLEDGCRIDVGRGLFTDQKWIDLVPSLFPSTVILRDPAYNVAFWNLHEREVTVEDGSFLVNGRPAAFFHISGFDPQRPDRLSKHQNRIEVAPCTPLAELLTRYSSLLLASGHEQAKGWEYGYERFADGSRVHPLLRQLYLNLGPEERHRFGDPFATAGEGTFLDWATRPDPERGGLSRFLETIYRVRYDLPLAFPDVRGRDRAAFVRWARRWGSSEMGFDPGLVREPTAAPELRAPEVAHAVRPSAAGNGAGVKAATHAGNGAATAVPPPSRDRKWQAYQEVVERIRVVVAGTLPAGSRVLVISKGDYRLVDLGGCEGWHFPQTDEGVYGGFHPPSSDVAIAHLEALREKGADYLLIPQTALWWLEFYDGFRQHLESRYRLVVMSHDVCHVYSLREPAKARTLRSDAGRRRRWLARRGASPARAGRAGVQQ
jgi:hypothetical protein